MRPKNLKLLLELCQQNSFFKLNIIDKNMCLQYSPLGSLLKRNIFHEWLFSLINNTDITLLPIEETIPKKRSVLVNIPNEERQKLLIDAFNKLNEEKNLCNFNMPSGFAIYGPCMKDSAQKETNNDPSDILRYLITWTNMSVLFFTPSTKKMNWFYFWSKQRYLWWRKLSSIPSKISMSEITSAPFIKQQLSIIIELPWGKECVETISLCEDEVIEEISKNFNKNHSSVLKKSVIMSETELDLAVIAYLTNSFEQEWRDKEIKNVLHLHYKLAPYKVGLVLESGNLEQFKKLKTISSHLSIELMKCGITVLPNTQNDVSSSTFSFSRFDAMGIPYTIVLNESSLEAGIAGLRNRDTTLEEQVHIAELCSKLVKYLN